MLPVIRTAVIGEGGPAAHWRLAWVIVNMLQYSNLFRYLPEVAALYFVEERRQSYWLLKRWASIAPRLKEVLKLIDLHHSGAAGRRAP